MTNTEQPIPTSKQIEKASEFSERIAILGLDIRHGVVRGAQFIPGPVRNSKSTDPAPQPSASKGK